MSPSSRLHLSRFLLGHYTSAYGRPRMRREGASVPLFPPALPVEAATVALRPACGCPFDRHRYPSEGHACCFDGLARPFLVQRRRFQGQACRFEGQRCRFFRHRCRLKGQRRRFDGHRCRFFRHRCRSKGQRRCFQGHRCRFFRHRFRSKEQRRHFQGQRGRRVVGGAGKEGVASKAGAARMRRRVVAHRTGGGFGPVDRPEGRA